MLPAAPTFNCRRDNLLFGLRRHRLSQSRRERSVVSRETNLRKNLCHLPRFLLLHHSRTTPCTLAFRFPNPGFRIHRCRQRSLAASHLGCVEYIASRVAVDIRLLAL
jgi:hypothetical protein